MIASEDTSRGRPEASFGAPASLRKLPWDLIVGHPVLLVTVIGAWHVLTEREILPPFFFGQPTLVARQIWEWFSTGFIWPHLGITLLETILAFLGGMVLGVAMGLWLGLVRRAASLFDPYVKALSATPRVILAPIFIVWFGLGIWSKVTLAMTLVFCIVFFSVYQGVREVSPTVLANARMLGASRLDLLRKVYFWSALTWVFASLHASVGMAFAGAVVGEYMGSSKGVGYLILQAEGVFDINAVYAGILTLTAFALALDGAVGVIERRLLRWQPT